MVKASVGYVATKHLGTTALVGFYLKEKNKIVPVQLD